MFVFMTETEEASLCGGESLTVSKGVYDNVVQIKGSSGKPGVKKQTVQSTSTTKVVKTISKGKIPQAEVSNLLSSLSSFLKLVGFDW